jgi:predicted PurR-regulated permease PerM
MTDASNTIHTPAVRDPRLPGWGSVGKRLAIWGLFLALLYLTRDFFFIAFMTFLFSYLALAVVGWIMNAFFPGAERPGVRRLVTLAIFVVAPLLLLTVGALVLPRLITEGQHLAGWVSRVSPEAEAAQLIEGYVGPSEFRREYGEASDQRYQTALAAFQASGKRHSAQYLAFPKLEDWIEGGFHRQFIDANRSRVHARLLSEGTSSEEFERWFQTKKYPSIQSQPSDDGPVAADTLLLEARHDPERLAVLRREWLADTLASPPPADSLSAEYLDQFRLFFEGLKKKSPRSIPYTFDQFIELQAARPTGPAAFGAALDKMQAKSMGHDSAGPNAMDPDASSLRADFEAAKQHELFQDWWTTSSLAKMVRYQLDTGLSGQTTGRVERLLASLLNVPVQLAAALLLSLFICIDFRTLQRAGRTLRDTWLRDAYDEVVPVFTRLGLLVGQAMRAQGLVALCNATLLFVALSLLGVEHSAILGAVTFVLCLVPSIGMLIAWTMIVTIALIQPGGGVPLALKASGAVVLVIALEAFVLSPRILGRLMELHPVLILAILPVAHYFFGIWGLVLAVPVSVYIINDVILERSMHDEPSAHQETESIGSDPEPIPQ